MGAAVIIDVTGETTGGQMLANADQTASVTSGSFDISNFIGRLKVTQSVGTTSGTNPTLAGKIQTSPDGATWTDLTGAVYPGVTGTSSNALSVDTRAASRYIRYVGTVGGTTPSFALAVHVTGQKQVQS